MIMNLNRKHEAQNDRQPHANRERVEEMLRDIAFVLKMTHRSLASLRRGASRSSSF